MSAVTVASLGWEGHFLRAVTKGGADRSKLVFDKQYRVTQCDGHWKIAHNGFSAGDFPTNVAAAAKAERLAREACGCGYDAELVIEDAQGRVCERRRFAK